MTIQRFSHIGVCVSDMERSRRFYREVLGFRELTRIEIDGGASEQLLDLENLQLRARILERDGVRIELLHYPSPGTVPGPVPRPMNQPGLSHFAVRVADLEKTLREIRAAGYAVLENTRISNPDFQSEVVYVTDPDGLRIELIEMPGDVDAPIGEPVPD